MSLPGGEARCLKPNRHVAGDLGRYTLPQTQVIWLRVFPMTELVWIQDSKEYDNDNNAVEQTSQEARSGLRKKQEFEKTRRMKRDQKIGRRPVILAAGPTQEQTQDLRAQLTAEHQGERGWQLDAAFTWKAPPRTPRSGHSPHPFPRQSFTELVRERWRH